MCSAKIPSSPAARFSGSLCSRDLILKLLHISSSIPSKLLHDIMFWCTKLPISQFFDEFSNAEKCFLHMTVTAWFPVSPPTVDGSHDFLLFLMLCQNFLGDLFHKPLTMASALHFVATSDKLLMHIWTLFTSFIMSNRGPLLGLWSSIQYKCARRAALCFFFTSLFHPGTLCFCFGLLVKMPWLQLPATISLWEILIDKKSTTVFLYGSARYSCAQLSYTLLVFKSNDYN